MIRLDELGKCRGRCSKLRRRQKVECRYAKQLSVASTDFEVTRDARRWPVFDEVSHRDASGVGVIAPPGSVDLASEVRNERLGDMAGWRFEKHRQSVVY